MQIYNGKGVSGGIAIGRIRVYKKRGQEINCISVTDTDKELIRFRDAKKEAARQIISKQKKNLLFLFCLVIIIHIWEKKMLLYLKPIR